MPIKQYQDQHLDDEPPVEGDDTDIRGYSNRVNDEGDDSGLRGSTKSKESSPESLARQEAHAGNRGDDSGLRELSKIPGLGGRTKGGDGASLPTGAAAAGLFKNETPVGQFKTFQQFFKKHKKGSAATGAVAGLVGLGLLFGATFLPGRVQAFVNQATQRWFASANQTLDDMGENYFNDYLKHHVLPGLGGNCPSTRRDKSCVADIPGNNPVSQLYNTWRVSNFENTLATKYGIEIARDVASNRLYMKVQGRKAQISLQDYVDGKYNNIFDMPEVAQSQVRSSFRQAIQNETLARRVLLRTSMRKVYTKYGVMRCIVACDKREKLTAKTAEMERAIKVHGARVISNLILARRVQDPQAQGLALAIQCMLSGGCEELVDGDNGEKVPKYQQQLSLQLKAYAAQFGKDNLDEMFKKYEGIMKEGFRSYLAQYIADKIVQGKGGDLEQRAAAKEAVSKAVAKGVPALGWASVAGQVVSSLDAAGPTLTAVRYTMVATGSIAMYTTYKAVVDEAKSGNTDLTILGSMSNSLNPGAKDDGSGPTAEASPWYHAEFQQQSTTTSLLDNLFGSNKAYAQSTTDQVTPGEPDKSTYLCDDGKPVPVGKLVCKEEEATGGVAEFNAISKAIPGPIGDLGGAVATGAGWLLAPLSSILSHIQPFKSISEWIGQRVTEFITWLSRDLIHLPFGDMSGTRKGDMIMAGADFAGNEAGHYVMGGQVATPAQARAIYDEQNRRDYETFRNRPLFARIFDKESTYSLVSRLSLSQPHGFGSWQANFANVLANPLGSAASGLSSIFASNKVLAQTPVVRDPIGVTQYYVPSSSPAFTDPRGPEKFWQEECADGSFTHAWREVSARNVNPLTGQADNPTTNPCLTIEGTLNPYGALMGYGKGT